MIAVVILIMRFVSARLSRYRQRAISVMLIGLLLAGATAARAQAVPPTPGAPDDAAQLRRLVEELQKRVAELEAHAQQQAPAASNPASTAALKTSAPAQAQVTPAQLTNDDRAILDYLKGTTVNLTVDGYYGYSFNHPIGRINLLRAYDVSSNSFSLNQAGVVMERAPDVAAGRRFGARLDLQYGQTTESQAGNPANELRPQAYRNIFQAYGTYIVPLGSGVTVDFGKWASALGIEGNYAKDQINYSRSYFFNFLPFYHMGFRAAYDVNKRFSVAYWLVNGAGQTEDFNGFKSQNFQVALKPSASLTWTTNYYTGQEQRDVVPVLNPAFPTLPTQPGVPTQMVVPAPDGRMHILDTYVSWSATPKLTLAAEGDYVINRVFSHSAPAHATGGAAYIRYQFTPKFAVGARAEYLSDRGGLFSGVTQALKETTFTTEYKLAEGFLMRGEWRRDFSNRPFFLTETPGVLKNEQNTATLGLIWWWGRKQGAW
jgi:hypothetical protein